MAATTPTASRATTADADAVGRTSRNLAKIGVGQVGVKSSPAGAATIMPATYGQGPTCSVQAFCSSGTRGSGIADLA